tara:strand:- start:109265 stop:110200 length:936 start_codon:yes stop_codon:yes gene_type:complete
MNRNRLVGVLLVALSATAFGAMAIFARYAYADGAGPVAVLFLRFLLAGTVLAVSMLITRRRWPRGRNLLVLGAMGGLFYVGQSLSFFTALNHAAAGLVALLLYLYPFLVTVLGALLLRRRLTVARMCAVLLALVGTALTLGGHLSGEPLGIALGLLAALIYSVYFLVGSLVLDREDPIASATVVMLAAAIVFGGIAVAFPTPFPATLSGWLAVGAIAVVSTVVAMVSLFAGIRRLGAADAATLSTLEPVVTVLLAAVFLAEPLQANQLLGGAVILSAVIWLTRAEASPAADATVQAPQPAAEGSTGRSSAL